MFQLISIEKQPEAMPGKKCRAKKKKGNGYGKGTFLEAKIFLCPAFFSLGQRGTSKSVSTVSVQMLALLLGKRQFRPIKDKKNSNPVQERIDNNQFTLTYKELESYGFSQPQATRGFDELLAKGFIEIADPGGTFEKHKALYSLTEDYQNWRPGHPPVRVRKRACNRGWQGKGLGAVKNNHRTRQQGTPTHTSTGDTPQKDTHVNGGTP